MKKFRLLVFIFLLFILSGCTNSVIDGEIDVHPVINESNLFEIINNPNFFLGVNMGQYEGFSFVDKFGENPDIDSGSTPETIWEGSTDYIYDSWGTAPIISLVSSDNGDINIPIEITGLDINGYEVVQTIELNGTSRVALDTPLYRVYRMQNVGDVGQDSVGIIEAYIGTSNNPVIGDVRAIINNGNHQSLMALYTIPRGYVGFLVRGEVGGSRSQNTGSIEFAYYSARLGKVEAIKKRVDTSSDGSSIYQDVRSAPDVIPALTDIKIQVEAVSANNIGAFATFDILLVNESKFSESYLKAIGQPDFN